MLNLATLAGLLAVGGAAAQETDTTVDFELFRPHPDAWGYYSVPSAATLRNLELGLGVWANYENDPVVLVQDDQRVSAAASAIDGDTGDGVVDTRFTGDVVVGMGLSRFFSLTVAIPYVMTQSGYELTAIDDPRVDAGALASGGMGDVRIQPKAVALDRDHAPVGLAVVLPASVPTGDGAALTGEGGVTVSPSLVAELSDGPIHERRYKFRSALLAGYKVRPEDRIRDVRMGNEVLFGLGVGVHPAPAFEMVAEFHGAVIGPRASQIPAEALLGTKLLLGRMVNLNLGAGTGVLGGVGAPDYRVVAGVGITPSLDPANRDTDKDGVPDGQDRCPREAEDDDDFKPEDGCPEADNDADNIPDNLDQCANDPEDDDGWMDVDGCPDPDNDKDGVLDVSDRCPSDAETMNGYQDEDGCPDESPIDDTDGDSYKDDVDRCPYDAEDFDQFQDEDGCPELDNDNDGIPDNLDRCPVVREIINGVDDEDGCPDEGRVIVEKEQIRIKDVIYFETGKATIQARSNDLIREIASVIQAHPELKRIRIEGHTDSVGNDMTNLRLSQARADSVKAAIARNGVEAARLDAVGFGEMRPIASNDDDDGRSRNRRVEFIIVERD